MTKNAKIPPRIAIAACCDWPFSNACGMTSRKAAPRSAPIAYDTSIGTHAARIASATEASAADSVPPAMLAARIHPRVIAVEILREPDQRGHALGPPIAPEGVEPLRVGVGAKAAAVDARHAASLQPLRRDHVQVEEPMARPRW